MKTENRHVFIKKSMMASAGLPRQQRTYLLTTDGMNTPKLSAPSRNCILTSVYTSSNGNVNMRSTYAKSEVVQTYPELLRKRGYYCTNNSKTDYNSGCVNPNAIWDYSTDKAHYRNRPEGKPFFAVFSLMASHESSINNRQTTGLLILKDKARHAIPVLKEAAYDRAGSVAALAAGALYGLGEKEISEGEVPELADLEAGGP